MTLRKKLISAILASSFIALITASMPPIPAPVPANMEDAHWWWPQSDTEYKAVKWGYDDPSGSVLVYQDFAGKYVNMRGGHRVVPHAPNISRRIWIFGNSTAVGLELPDRYTFPSILQMLVGNAYRVENMGLAGIDIKAIAAWMKLQPVSDGDVILLLDGVFIRDEEAYAKEVQDARDWVIAHGAAFYFVLQPFQPSVWPQLVGIYPEFRRALKDASWMLDWGAMFKDQERVFAGRAGVHFNDEGSIVLAARLYLMLLSKLG